LRAGTASAKNRGRVSGGGRKIYKQKGTGRARAGSSRAPQRRGGGVCFGPRPRDYTQKLPRKIRIKALFSALAMKYQNGLLRIVSGESLSLDSHKTSDLVPIIHNHAKHDKVIIVDVADFPNNLILASRNLTPKIRLFNCQATELSCHAVLESKVILLTPGAIDKLVSMFK